MPSEKPLRVAIPSMIEDGLLRYLPPGVEVVRYSQANPAQEEVDLLVPMTWPGMALNAAKLLGCIRARYIQTMSAGVEAFVPFLPEGTVLCNARGLHDSTTAEWAVTALLATLKWLPYYDDLRRERHWPSGAENDTYWQRIHGVAHHHAAPVAVEELAGKTVLIVGYGSIGKAIEARLQPFEPKVLRIARRAREGVQAISELPTLLPQADAVVLITPLTPETHRLIGAQELASMRKGAIVVNAARGGVIDTDALVHALESHHVRAALDVTDPEPLPPDHPLWKAPNLLLTPHVAGSVERYLDRVFQFIGKQVERLLAGEPPVNIVSGAY